MPKKKKKGYAKGRQKTDDYKSSYERRYADYLEGKRLDDKILAWWYEPMSLRLAKGARYTPDFLVLENDLTLSVIEVKGRWTEASRVRIKIAAGLYPFKFSSVIPYANKPWKREEF